MAAIALRIAGLLCALILLALLAGQATTRGDEMAFVSVRDGNYEIYRMDVSSGLAINVTHSRGGDWSPVWSPDGAQIAFVSNRDGSSQVYTLDVDTSRLRQMTSLAATNMNPVWSPDGSQIAFTSNRGGDWGVYIADATCDSDCEVRLHKLSDDFPRGRGALGRPAWSPDSRYLAVTATINSGAAAIHLVDTRSGALTYVPSRLVDTRLNWSADSQSIAYTSIQGFDLEIYAFNISSGEYHNLSQSNRYDGTPNWSPDGQQVAFESDRDGMREIYRVNGDGGDLQRLTHMGPNARPVWSPDGRWLVFESERDGNRELYLMDSDGQAMRRLTFHPADDSLAVWRP